MLDLPIFFPAEQGGSLPFVPPTAFAALIAHPLYTRSDVDKLVPCGNGDGIRWWYDPVTQTWHEQATLASRLVLETDALSATGYCARGAAGRQHICNFSGVNTSDFTLAGTGVLEASSPNTTLAQTGASSSAINQGHAIFTEGSVKLRYRVGSPTQRSDAADSAKHRWAVSRSGGDLLRFIRDGDETTSNDATDPSSNNVVVIGSLGTGIYAGDCRIHSVILFNYGITAAQAVTLLAGV